MIEIQSGTLALPRLVETLKRLELNFTVDTLNDRLTQFVAGAGVQGYLKADFTVRGGLVAPRSTVGKLSILAGVEEIFAVRSLSVQIEAGPKVGKYESIGALVATGVGTGGRPFVFQSYDFDDTSLLVRFGIAETTDVMRGLLALAEYLKAPAA